MVMGVRWVLLVLAAAAIICFALYLGSGQARFRRWGWLIAKWSFLAALAYVAVLTLQRWLPRS